MAHYPGTVALGVVAAFLILFGVSIAGVLSFADWVRGRQYALRDIRRFPRWLRTRLVPWFQRGGGDDGGEPLGEWEHQRFTAITRGWKTTAAEPERGRLWKS